MAHLPRGADTLSLPGALPLGWVFPLHSCTSYTPDWCVAYVRWHPFGAVPDDLTVLPAWIERLLLEGVSNATGNCT
jgi:hypothetical protein